MYVLIWFKTLTAYICGVFHEIIKIQVITRDIALSTLLTTAVE